MVGKRFGKLVVIGRAGSDHRKSILWNCQCDCGNKKTVKGVNLRNNHTKSCGCFKKGIDRSKIEGRKFHSLTITRYLHSDKYRESIYEYKCDCGNTGEIRLQKIGKTKKCPQCRRQTYGEISGAYWNSVKRNAQTRKIEFKITPEMAWDKWEKQKGQCALTGLLLAISRKTKFFTTGQQTASLDRIDNKKGYTQNNIQWVHKKVNELKWDLSVDELLHWCRLILEYKNE